jgi:putative transcriptional regulator
MKGGNLQKGKTDWKRLRGMTDVEVLAANDEDALPFTRKELGKVKRVRPNVSAIRRKLGMSQREFGTAFGFPLASLRDWEQGRSLPSRPTQTLLWVIAEQPNVVRRVVKRKTPA